MLKISSSSISRNMICPSSLLHEQVYVKKEESEHALEGTEKHLEMEMAAKGGKLSPLAAIFQTQMRIIEPEFSFQKSIAECKISRIIKVDNSIAKLTGKIDLIFICNETKTIHIVDYKFGFMQVEAIDNDQLFAYGLLVRKELYYLHDFKIKCSIYQDEIFNTIEIADDQLEHFEYRLLQMIRDSKKETYNPHPDACKYCSFRPNCPAIIEKVAEIVDPPNILQKKDLISRNLKLIQYVVKDVEADLKKRLKTGEILDYCELKNNGSYTLWNPELNQEEIIKLNQEINKL